MRRLRTERAFPIRGIREDLPEGERVLWQGAPAWRDLAASAFHVRKVAVYFGLLLALRLALLVAEGAGPLGALRGAAPLFGLALVCEGLLLGLAFWSARSTIYAITTRRVVMRVGMALPLVINLPFTGIQSARLARRSTGHGDLPLGLDPGVRLAYAHLWPYARPWCLKHPEPMLRALPQAEQVAHTLAQALATSGGVAMYAAAANSPSTQASAPAPAYGMPRAAARA